MRGLTYREDQAEFVRKFHKPASTRANIRLLVHEFKITGSVQDAKRSGGPSVSAETMQQVDDAISRSPKASGD